MADPYPFLRQVRPPLTREQLAPLDPRCQVVQFFQPLSEAEHARLADFMRAYPGVPLRVYGNQVTRLDFLCHHPFLSGFQVDLFDLESLDGLEHLPASLRFFAMGATRSKRFGLDFLARFPDLRELALDSQSKGIQALGRLTRLERLTLRSITLPDLSLLHGLEGLWWLALKLGGTKDLSLLPSGLKYLELWRVRGLEDLSPVARLERLQFLFLQDLKQVARLPDLSRLTRLRRVHLEGMRGLTDLSPLATAPALEGLRVVMAQHLRPAHFAPLRGHPRLRDFFAGTGSLKRNQEAQQVVGLPAAGQLAPFRFT